MDLKLDRASGLPLARQISEGIRSEIDAGTLGAGDRLPAERDLARRLRVDRMTVARAYDLLASSGVVTRHVGRGSFVADTPGTARAPRADAATASVPWSWEFAPGSSAALPGAVSSLHAAPPEGSISFSTLFPDPSLFPVDAFRRCLEKAIRREGSALFSYGPAGGYPPLRRHIASWMLSRGVDAAEEEIVVTNGSQQGIDLVARALLSPGDRVVVENPTYTGAVQLFLTHGAKVVGVPLDRQGIRPDHLEEALARGGARLLYLIPNFQNPTSGTTGLERRRLLLDIARRHRVPILEDDFGGELRFEGEEIPSLKALEPRGGVIYLNTFAKKLLPGLRIGWVAAPREVAERISFLKQITDWNTSLLLQAALYEFCRQGLLERHLKRVVAAYRERRDAMMDAMRRHFPREVRWTKPEGGLVVWVTLPPGMDADEVASECRSRGVLVGRGDLFHVDGGRHNNLRLVYAQADPAAIRRGIRAMGSILGRKLRERRTAAREGVAESLPII
jgi:DNA-binding transcriptional MocR family regulator